MKGLPYLLVLTMLSFSSVVSFSSRQFNSAATRQQKTFHCRRWPPSQPSRASSTTRLYNSDDNSSASTYWTARQGGCWRPDVSDVERISWGKPAKRKGTGSRGVPHRLNQEERFLYDQARQKGFLEVAGSAWRSQRREAPLLNTYRSLCDARGKVCIVLHKSNTGVEDEVVMDLSPLRYPQDFEQIKNILQNNNSIASSNKDDESCSSSMEIQQLLGPYVEHEITLPTNTIEEEESSWVNTEGIASPEENSESDGDKAEEEQWENRPIYQLPPYCVSWGRLPRSNAKKLSKLLSLEFQVPDPKAAKKSRKSKGIKAGKSRRSGGYGIG